MLLRQNQFSFYLKHTQKHQANDKAFGLWFFANKFPDMLPEIAVPLIKFSLISGDIDGKFYFFKMIFI